MSRIVVSLLLLLSTAALAGAGEPITIGETITLPSKIMGEDRTILVSTPPGYPHGGQSYPVLYMTDGDVHLTHTRGTVDFLARNGLMPQVIIVGVANTDRTRDLTPTRANVADRDGTPREFPTSGGADRFLDFFEEELFPWVDAHYRTEPYRVFAGHSFGGLFALHAFATRPSMFGGVVAVSPSLRWDDDLPLRQTVSLLQAREELSSVLFVSMADEEEDQPRPNRLDRLEQALRTSEVEGLEWQVRRFPDETHGSVVLLAHYWGLQRIFRPWLLPVDRSTGATALDLDGLKAHYSTLSKRLGYEVTPPENAVNLLGYRLLGDNDVEGALEVFRYNVELYPDAPNVHDSLGEALEQAGRLAEAFACYSRAVDRAAASGDARLDLFKANRDRVRTQL
jgi:predicted alpha/beta superfamily hydrolase